MLDNIELCALICLGCFSFSHCNFLLDFGLLQTSLQTGALFSVLSD